MKTLNFAKFAKDKIQEKELNSLIGGTIGSGDPINDLLAPPKR